MSFRASHYFVSFMSEAALIAAGFGCTVAGSQVILAASNSTLLPLVRCNSTISPIIPPLGAVALHSDPTSQHRGAEVTRGGGCLLEPSHAPVAQAICLQTGCHQLTSAF